MAFNVAEFVLADIYDLYEAALGASAAWWVGHLTLLGLATLGIWAATNWADIAHGLEINGMRIWTEIFFIGVTGGQILLYMDQFGFPISGAFLTALSVSLYLRWQWYQLEPQKA
jgi:hypothetical protein